MPLQTLWLERTTLQTEAPLPGILRWFPVTASRREMVSPIQHACETVQTANRQLRQLIAQHSAPGAPDNISPLSMRLQVSVSPLSMRLQVSVSPLNMKTVEMILTSSETLVRSDPT